MKYFKTRTRFQRKGFSVLVSHAAFLAVGAVALMIISAMIWGVYDSIIKEQIRRDLSRASEAVAGEIVKLYSLKSSSAVPDANTSLLLGESSLSLQQKAGGRQYSIELFQSSQITISNITGGNTSSFGTRITASTDSPLVQVNYTLYNIEAGVQGSGFGDKPLALKYFRLNSNGTIEDRIILNDALIIAGESMS